MDEYDEEPEREPAPPVGLRLLFWALQLLLASVLVVPIGIVVVGGRVGFNEFAEWIVGFFVIVGFASLIANALRRGGWIGSAILVLLIALTPFVLLGWFFIEFARNWHN